MLRDLLRLSAAVIFVGTSAHTASMPDAPAAVDASSEATAVPAAGVAEAAGTATQSVYQEPIFKAAHPWDLWETTKTDPSHMQRLHSIIRALAKERFTRDLAELDAFFKPFNIEGELFAQLLQITKADIIAVRNALYSTLSYGVIYSGNVKNPDEINQIESLFLNRYPATQGVLWSTLRKVGRYAKTGYVFTRDPSTIKASDGKTSTEFQFALKHFMESEERILALEAALRQAKTVGASAASSEAAPAPAPAPALASADAAAGGASPSRFRATAAAFLPLPLSPAGAGTDSGLALDTLAASGDARLARAETLIEDTSGESAPQPAALLAAEGTPRPPLSVVDADPSLPVSIGAPKPVQPAKSFAAALMAPPPQQTMGGAVSRAGQTRIQQPRTDAPVGGSIVYSYGVAQQGPGTYGANLRRRQGAS